MSTAVLATLSHTPEWERKRLAQPSCERGCARSLAAAGAPHHAGCALRLARAAAAVAGVVAVAGLGGGAVEVYALTPGWDARDLSSPPLYRATSRHLALNGRVLAVDERGALPPMPPELQPPPATGQPTRLTLPPLTAMFAVFREAGAGACMQE